MCINTKIQNLLQQKQNLDAEIAKLEQFDQASSAVRLLLEKLIEEYETIAPEELNQFLGEIAMTLSANEIEAEDSIETYQDYRERFAREAIAADITISAEPSAKDIALVEKYREPNNPMPQEATEAIESALEENQLVLVDPVISDVLAQSIDDREIQRQEDTRQKEITEDLEAWGFSLWDEEEARAIGLPSDSDFVTLYKEWEIYLNIPNGGVLAIQLKSLAGDIYDRSTELDDNELYGFPNDLCLGDQNGILKWTKDVIDGLEYRLVPFKQASENDPRIKLFTGSLKLDSVNLTMEMSPATHNVKGSLQLSGVTFKFSDPEGNLIFESQKTAEEIEDKQPMYLGLVMAIKWTKNSRQEIANSSKATQKDDFAEFVKISNSVGYLKRRDNGQILSGYIGLSNKIANGERATTMAHNRARKWADYLSGNFDAKCEVRKPKRMESDNGKAPFAYEVKFSGLSIGQITQLGKQNFDLLPYEEEEKQENAKLLQSEVNVPQKTFSVAINGYSFKSGGESEVRSIFEEEILKLSPHQLTVDFYEGATQLERWSFHELNFVNSTDFDELNPEFNVHHIPSSTSVKVWSSLRSTAGKTERFWRHNLLQPGEEIALHTREAAAVHAIRRQQQLTTPQI